MTDMLEILKKLPARCVVGPTEAKTLAIDVGYCIHRGRPGYSPLPSLTDAIAAELNKEWGVTPAQAEAMQIGSMFGWDCPGANPDNYETKVQPKKVLA